MDSRTLFLIIILTACTQTFVQTVPYNGTITTYHNTTLEGCTNCASGETCRNNSCVCTGKLCRGACIAASACCTSADCPEGTCINNQCTIPTQRCAFNEKFQAGECTCAPGYSRCREQEKCIKQGDCCYSGNCPRGDRCASTVWKSSICFQIDSKRSCRLLADNNRTERVTIDTLDVRMGILSWWNDGNITLSINNQTRELAKNQSQPFDQYSIYQEGIESIGGICKEDNEV